MTTQDGPSTDPYSGKLGDWRLANSLWALAQDGVPFPEPLPAQQVSVFRSNDRTQFSFGTPSAAALHLSTAWKAAARAAQIKRGIALDPAGIQPGLVALQVAASSVPTLFDYFEEMMTVAFSSFAAVEAFCNQTVVEKATAPITVKRKKGEVLLSAEEVEREVGTKEKLSRILPDLLKMPSPSGKAVWHRYVGLQEHRDAVTHFKRRDQARKVISEPTALFRLYTEDCFSMPSDAMTVIRYFFPAPDTEPRWLRNPAWVRPANASPT